MPRCTTSLLKSAACHSARASTTVGSKSSSATPNMGSVSGSFNSAIAQLVMFAVTSDCCISTHPDGTGGFAATVGVCTQHTSGAVHDVAPMGSKELSAAQSAGSKHCPMLPSELHCCALADAQATAMKRRATRSIATFK
eukprot:Amastigsp_a174980_79.p5 type:complete len:139 gc:universal Amastigsp_a174980_79:1135-1551(+)